MSLVKKTNPIFINYDETRIAEYPSNIILANSNSEVILPYIEKKNDKPLTKNELYKHFNKVSKLKFPSPKYKFLQTNNFDKE
jgi:hypothetical protein